MKKLMTVLALLMCGCAFAAKGTREERIAALEGLLEITCFNIDDPADLMPEEHVRIDYELTKEEFRQDLLALANKYGADETNRQHRLARCMAIGNIAIYGTTNDLAYLSAIWHNVQDCAQVRALGAAMAIEVNTDAVFDIANEVLTNVPPYSTEMREQAYSVLAEFYDNTTNVTQEQKGRIAAYFLSRVDLEREPTYAYLDRKVCEMFPSYRHSQRRRDNLAAVYDPTLTGAPKEVYEARVRDAQPVEE